MEHGLWEDALALLLYKVVCPRATFPCCSSALPSGSPRVSLCQDSPVWIRAHRLLSAGQQSNCRECVGKSLVQLVSFSTSLLSFTRLHLAYNLMLTIALLQGRLFLRHEVMDNASHLPGTCIEPVLLQKYNMIVHFPNFRHLCLCQCETLATKHL